MDKGKIVKGLMLLLFQAGMWFGMLGAPAPPSPRYPFGKPLDPLALSVSGFCFMGIFGLWVVFFHYRKALVGSGYYWISAVIRDLLLQEEDNIFAIPKNFMEKELTKKEIEFISPEVRAIASNIYRDLRQELVWRKVPVTIYDKNDRRYDTWVIIGSSESLLDHIGPALRTDTIELEGLPVNVEYCNLEFLKLETLRFIRRLSLRGRMKKWVERNILRKKPVIEGFHYYISPQEDSTIPPEEVDVLYEVKEVPVYLLMGSSPMYQKYAAFGLGVIKVAENDREAINLLEQIAHAGRRAYAEVYEHHIRAQEKIIDDLTRVIDKKVDLGARVEGGRVLQESLTTTVTSSRWLKVLAALFVGGIILIILLSYMGVI